METSINTFYIPEIFNSKILKAPYKFSTGDLPSRSSISGKIISFNNVVVLGPRDEPDKASNGRKVVKYNTQRRYLNYLKVFSKKKEITDLAITYSQAQNELKKLRDASGAVHEHIAFEAAGLTGDPEVQDYALHIVAGALAEDFVFMPGETLKEVLLIESNDKKVAKEYGNIISGIGSGLFILLGKLINKICSKREDDPYNRPYMGHFYDPSPDRIDFKGLYIPAIQVQMVSALDRFKKYLISASCDYVSDKIGLAFYKLGHAVHLVSDMSVPAHVHNDVHGPTKLLGKLDSFEQWTAGTGFPHIRLTKGKTNARIWNNNSLSMRQIDSDINYEEYFVRISSLTQRFKSRDIKGRIINEQKEEDNFKLEMIENVRKYTPKEEFGKYIQNNYIWDQKRLPDKGLTDFKSYIHLRPNKGLNDLECYIQGCTLVPKAIMDSAELICNFLNVMRK